MQDSKERMYTQMLDKSVYVVLKTKYQRNGLLIEETANSVKILGLSRLSVIPKDEIAVIDIDRSSIELTESQKSELLKIRQYLKSKNDETRRKLRKQGKMS